MSKRFLAIHHFLEKMMLIEFGVVFVLAILTAICPIKSDSLVLSTTLSICVVSLMITTALCFGTSTIWFIQYMNSQVEMFLKYYEEILKANGFGPGESL